MEKINEIRRAQSIISIIIFAIAFIFCWYTTKFNLLDIQLSFWGVEKSSSLYWNGTLFLLGASLFFNVYVYITQHKRLIFKKQSVILFGTVFAALSLTGLIPMNYFVHNITAVYYFFMLPLVIFIMAYKNKLKLQYNEWLGHTIFSGCMIVLPLIFIHMFKGMAISEIVHSSVVMIWSLWILNKKFV